MDHVNKLTMMLMLLLLTAWLHAQNSKGPTKSTLLFIDKSHSVNYTRSEEVKNRVMESLQDIIKSRYSKYRDIIRVFYIHSSTSSANAVASYDFQLVNGCDTLVSNIRRNQCNSWYYDAVSKEMRRLYAELDGLISNPYSGSTGQYTNIHDVLEVASRSFPDAKSELQIFIFSDMIHDCPKVNLKSCPTSRDGAESLARKHALEMRKNLHSPERLQGCKVFVITPDDALSPIHNKNYLRYYWTEFFNHFKMKLDPNW